MQPLVANCHWILLPLIHFISGGLAVEQNKDGFKTTPPSSNSLMDDMMSKFSYPKSEVTAGVGYGHHLHPFYYRGGKEAMYPCAVECGEWETMDPSEDSDDAGSNVEEVTARPDVSTIEITTPKPRPYKDISSLRPKNYQASTSTTATPKISHNDYVYQDLKGANVNLRPQKVQSSPYGSKEVANDGSLYAKFQDDLLSSYEGEVVNESKDNAYFDPMEESLSYSSPSFDDDDQDDINAPVYPTPNRERIEEKYTKHNIREEHLEDVRSNSFVPLVEDPYESENYQVEEKPANSYNPSNFIDDFAAPRPYHSYPPNNNYNGVVIHKSVKPFRPSLVQGKTSVHPQGYKAYSEGHKKGHSTPQNGYTEEYIQSDEVLNDYDYAQNNVYEDPYAKPPGQVKGNHLHRGQDYKVRHSYAKKRPAAYGRYPVGFKPSPVFGVVNPYEDQGEYSPPEIQTSSPKVPVKKYAAYQRGPHSRNIARPYSPYAAKQNYPSLEQNSSPNPVVSGGIRVVPPPRRPHPPRYSSLPYYNMGSKPKVKSGSFAGGRTVGYRRSIPRKDGFTRIVKRYRTFVDHQPKRHISSSKPYVGLS